MVADVAEASGTYSCTQDRHSGMFCDLASEDTHSHFHNLLVVVQLTLFGVGAESTGT